MIINQTLEFSAGHRLHLYKGKCSNLHGHNYKAVIMIDYGKRKSYVRGVGFITDFAGIKKIIRDRFDHKFLMSEKDPYSRKMSEMKGLLLLGYSPTAENIAIEIANLVYAYVIKSPDTAARVSVELFETSSSSAVYVKD